MVVLVQWHHRKQVRFISRKIHIFKCIVRFRSLFSFAIVSRFESFFGHRRNINETIYYIERWKFWRHVFFVYFSFFVLPYLQFSVFVCMLCVFAPSEFESKYIFVSRQGPLQLKIRFFVLLLLHCYSGEILLKYIFQLRRRSSSSSTAIVSMEEQLCFIGSYYYYNMAVFFSSSLFFVLFCSFLRLIQFFNSLHIGISYDFIFLLVSLVFFDWFQFKQLVKMLNINNNEERASSKKCFLFVSAFHSFVCLVFGKKSKKYWDIFNACELVNICKCV